MVAQLGGDPISHLLLELLEGFPLVLQVGGKLLLSDVITLKETIVLLGKRFVTLACRNPDLEAVSLLSVERLLDQPLQRLGFQLKSKHRSICAGKEGTYVLPHLLIILLVLIE